MTFSLGMPLMLSLGDIPDHVRLAREHGFSFIDINLNLPTFSIRETSPYSIREIKEETGIGFTVHLIDSIDLACFDYTIRMGYVNYFLEVIEWCKEAGVGIINTHISIGNRITLPDKVLYVYEERHEDFLGTLYSSIDIISGQISYYDIRVCIENTSMFHMPFMRDGIENLLKYFDISLTWDVGHDAKCGYKERDFILKHKDRLAFMHLHDIVNGFDHQPLCTGEIDTGAMLDLAKSMDIPVLIEVKTPEALIQSIKGIRDSK